jgi:hypothetical protein
VAVVEEDEDTGRPGDVESTLAGGAVGTDGPAGVRSVESERMNTTATSAAAVAVAIAIAAIQWPRRGLASTRARGGAAYGSLVSAIMVSASALA